MFESGDVAKGTISCGQGIGLIHDVKPCKEIVQDIMQEAHEVSDKLGKMN